ncbi:MAG TPA: protein kinase [Coleofasciculaceae cyanobacterium]
MEIVLAGHYQIVRYLGSGGFGQTFLAKDTHLPGNPLCVVKQLKPRVTDSATLETAKCLFEREAQTLYRLGNHDQIPRLLAHFEQDEEFYLVQEFIEGQPLDQELADRRQLSEASVIGLLQDILQVLAFVHQQNVIHRDIKPANLIRRSRDNKIVLIDFGAVKEVSNQAANTHGHTSLTIAIGSPGYMPSEQVSFKPHFSSDIYALGMVCMQALSGLSPTELPKDSRTGEFCCTLFRKLAPVSPGLAAILDKMVRYDYRQRYETATQALQALEQLQNQGQAASTILMPPSPPRLVNEAEGQVNLDSTRNVARPSIEADSQAARNRVAAEQRMVETDSRLSRQEYRNRQILLNKVRNYWVKGVLETSLHGRSIIELGLEERSEAVERPWGLLWESSDAPQQPLPPGTHLIDKFDEIGSGRTLLILGKPGSGKTTTLLELARDLIHRAELDLIQPMPVVFNLSSWSGHKQAIADWLVQELHTKYQVSQEIGQSWVKEQQLLLLLDGLDEVSATQQQACVVALNHFSQEHGQTEMVVCSRIKDYEALPTRLRFQAAIYLQPLTLEQIHHYLKSAGSKLAAVSTALHRDTTLQELAQTPLMLSIMTLAYQGMSIEELPSRNREELCQHLFDAYIERMFNRRGVDSRYSKAQAKQWLIWLAKQMVQQSQTVFLIERLQPDWLPKTYQKWLYAIAIGLITCLSIGIGVFLIVWLLIGLHFGLIAGVTLGFSSGIIAGLVFGLISNQISPVETLKWSWLKARNNLKLGLLVGLIVGLLISLSSVLFYGLLVGLEAGLIEGLLVGLRSGVSVGLSLILLRGLTGSGIETSTVPNQGIRQSIKYAIALALISALALGVGSWIIGIPILGGVIIGLLFGLFGAGEACVKHFTLRVVLYCHGYIPWNYAHFLDYATQLIFLQKVGGGYIFIHRLLLEHFAGLVTKKL